MPNFEFGERSRSKLHGVHPGLQRVVHRALSLSRVDFMVVEGVRSLARQKELYSQGRTRPGPKVTWSMESRHLAQGLDGFGKAVDLAPLLPGGGIDWNDKTKFLSIGKSMFTAANELRVQIRWGYDWDGDGRLMETGEYDGPHFELIKARYP